MFRNTHQKGILSIFLSIGSNPLLIWKTSVKNGYVKRLTDKDLNSVVLEIMSVNVETAYITTPIHPKTSLAIKLPFFVLIIKYVKKFFSFEVQVLDDTNMTRRFRISNYQRSTNVNSFGTTMPLALNPGWNQIQLNLSDFTRRAYGTNYVETVRVQIHANTRIRTVFFCDRLYKDDEKPKQFRLFTAKENISEIKKKSKSLLKKQHPATPIEGANNIKDKIAVKEKQ